MLPACESMESWLKADPANVVVVHCKAGKGRTGTIIAAYLVHCRACTAADDAIQLFGNRRTKNGRGITIPSQQRYVKYYALQVTAVRHRERQERTRSVEMTDASTPGTVNGPVTTDTACGTVLRHDIDSSSGKALITLEVRRDAKRAPGFGVTLPADVDFPVISSVETSDISADPALVNSVIPVPVMHLLKVGDELVAVNGVDLTKRGFTEVTTILRGALDPLHIRVRRPVLSGGKVLDVAPITAATPQQYIQRVARAIGPWAADADPRVVPTPVIQITGVHLSHIPDISSKAQCGATAHNAGWYFMIYGGPGCRSVVYDSRDATVGYTLNDNSHAISGADTHIELPLLPASKSSVLTPSSAQISWGASAFSSAHSPAICSGDVRVILGKQGFRKPFASVWLHTAFLPLPADSQAAVRQQILSVAQVETVSQHHVLSEVTPPTPTLRPSEEGAAGAALAVTPSPLVALDAGQGGQCTRVHPTTLLSGDVPGVRLHSRTPLLGALFSASNDRVVAGIPSTQSFSSDLPAALGCVCLSKASLDGAIKDKKHKIFPADFQLLLEYNIYVPREYNTSIRGSPAPVDTSSNADAIALRI
jgi:hypothetical protein